ncbi:uncharacterized protein LOC116143784 [Pistacia vera]|uniref:uncharacterized protein LOC116143784 n=1 Tax=Pistacia vera TaxID=55513 RepID=UPI001263D468|nr:uncharacterized protein LOC116143784 [Pistacia vera]
MSSAGILTEAIKCLFKNWKLLAYTYIITIVFSLYFMFIILSSNSWTNDLIFNQNSPCLLTDSFIFSLLPLHIRQQLRFITGLILISSFAYLNLFLFSLPATILASSITTCSSSIDFSSFKDFISKLMRLLMRPFVTCLHITLFNVCYTAIVLVILFSLVPQHNQSSIPSIVVFFFALCFYNYLDVVWTLGAVASATEEKIYGMEAFSKAAKLVEGRKLGGFAINNFFKCGTTISRNHIHVVKRFVPQR